MRGGDSDTADGVGSEHVSGVRDASQETRSRLFSPSLLDGQVAIVTGGGSGLGRETALELARCGARVVVCGRREEPLLETVAADPRGLIEARRVRHPRGAAGRFDGGWGHLAVTARSTCSSTTPAVSSSRRPSRSRRRAFRTVIRLNVEGTWLVTHAVATKAMIPSGRGGKVLQRDALAPQRHAGHGTLGRRPGGRREPDAHALGGVGPLSASACWRSPPGSSRRRPCSRSIRRRSSSASRTRSRSGGWAPSASSPGSSPTWPRRPATSSPARSITMDGARDDWLGPWPPAQAADEQGTPLSEERRCGRAEQFARRGVKHAPTNLSPEVNMWTTSVDGRGIARKTWRPLGHRCQSKTHNSPTPSPAATRDESSPLSG